MATNRIDILDPALLRPGRIDRKIEFPPPNEEARLDILKIHSRKMNLTRGINLRKIAELMPGASGAEVKVNFANFKFFPIHICLFQNRECAQKQECMLLGSAEFMSLRRTLRWQWPRSCRRILRRTCPSRNFGSRRGLNVDECLFYFVAIIKLKI